MTLLSGKSMIVSFVMRIAEFLTLLLVRYGNLGFQDLILLVGRVVCFKVVLAHVASSAAIPRGMKRIDSSTTAEDGTATAA